MNKLILELEKHIGKTVVIFTNNARFIGILISVEYDFLRLLIIPSQYFFKKQNKFKSRFGAVAIIPLNSLSSLTYISV